MIDREELNITPKCLVSATGGLHLMLPLMEMMVGSGIEKTHAWETVTVRLSVHTYTDSKTKKLDRISKEIKVDKEQMG